MRKMRYNYTMCKNYVRKIKNINKLFDFTEDNVGSIII